MKVSGTVNQFRRKVMFFLTNHIGKDKYKANPICCEEIKRVLINRPNNRLGNQLLLTPLVQEVTALFPACKIDLFVRGGVASVLFQNYPNVDRIIKLPRKPFKELFAYIRTWVTLRNRKYDVVINANGASSSGRLSTQFTRSDYKFYCDPVEDLETRYADYAHMAKSPIYNLRYALGKLGCKGLMEKPFPQLSIHLSPEEIAAGREVLHRIVPSNKKTICFYTFATGGKCYTEEWWAAFYQQLNDTYKDTYNLLEVLPVENVSQIGFAAPSYYSKDIREIAAVIENAEIFILADSGIMHLGSATSTPIVGLFSVTNIERYRPYNRGSIAIDTKVASIGDIMKEINETSKRNPV